MSAKLISRSPDLQRLREDGFDIEVHAGHLLVRGVPYVNRDRRILRGTLVSTLCVAGDTTTAPDGHVVYFAGDEPCHHDGRPFVEIINARERRELAPGLVADFSFSSRPKSGAYGDYYAKMTTYVRILSAEASAIDESVTAQTHPVVQTSADESVFKYIDTASSRAGIGAISRKLEPSRVAIVGMGGSGSYVLDLVAKTPVIEIHAFDGDTLLNHNAFRAPGAASLEQLKAKPNKAEHYAAIYSTMRRGIVPHPYDLDPSNVGELAGMDFVFLCIDNTSAKREIVDKLDELGVPFVDVGMGLYVADGKIYGQVRVTTASASAREHIRVRCGIVGFRDDGDDDGVYGSNVQIAELNSLSATLAVIKWKKLFGFYGDTDSEHHSVYAIAGNELINEEKP